MRVFRRIESDIKIDTDDVDCVYVGQEKGCRCGCNGKYYYTERNRDYSSKSRGYEVSDDEINTAKVLEVINLMEKSGCQIENQEDYIFDTSINGAIYTIYLMKK